MIYRIKIITLLIFALVGVLSCMSGSASPILPGVEDNNYYSTQDDANNLTYPSAQTFNGRHLWLYREILIDPVSLDFELTSPRQLSSHWNILRWLEESPCTDCLKVESVTPTGTGTVDVVIEITHPFSVGNLTGFDVRGIAMFEGSQMFPESGLVKPDRHSGNGELVNAEGYTSLYNFTTAGTGPEGMQGYQAGHLSSPVSPDATLNGYIRYVSPEPKNTRNIFYAGTSISRTFEIDMPDGEFIFGYAVDTCWVPPVNKPVLDPVEDFPTSANCPEPWKIEVFVEPVSEGLSNFGGYTKLLIDVYDWQGKESHLAPELECPDLFSGFKSANLMDELPDYTSFEIIIGNEKLAPAGTYEILIKVWDTANILHGNVLDLSAYQVVPLDVIDLNETDPVAIGRIEQETYTVCEEAHFLDDGSYDLDGGDIALYEWDWNNDGVFEDSGYSIYHVWDEASTFLVQMRVTDNEGVTDTLDTPLEITILNALPTATAEPLQITTVVNEPILFSGALSYDNDCDQDSIICWEWDWNNDGAFGELKSEPTIQHSFSELGNHDVQLRVTDDEGGTDVLNSPLRIFVEGETFDPVAQITVSPGPYYTNTDITYDGGTSYDPDGGDIELYEWDLDNDGIFSDAFGQSVQHSFSAFGEKRVNLRVTDDEGSTDFNDTPFQIVVLPEPEDPHAFADANPTTQSVCEEIQFVDDGSYDPDGGTIELYEWDWNNDGIFDETGLQKSHSWDETGTYYVQMRVTDDEGVTSLLDTPLEINIENVLPTAGAVSSHYSQTVCDPITLNASQSHDNDCGDGAIVSWEWDLDNDGTFTDDNGEIIEHSFNTTGLNYVQLRVTDDEGGSDTLDVPIQITINNALPTASASADDQDVYIGAMVNFDGLQSHDNDCAGSIVEWAWDLHYDGMFNAEKFSSEVSQSYPAPGTYQVMLRVTDDEEESSFLANPLSINVSPFCEEIEPNDETDTAAPVIWDCPTDGGMNDPDHSDVFTFTLTESKLVTFDCTYEELINGSFSWVLSNSTGIEDSGFNSNNPINESWTLEPDTYYMMLIGSTGSSFTYNFTFSR